MVDLESIPEHRSQSTNREFHHVSRIPPREGQNSLTETGQRTKSPSLVSKHNDLETFGSETRYRPLRCCDVPMSQAVTNTNCSKEGGENMHMQTFIEISGNRWWNKRGTDKTLLTQRCE
ncbi:uncharacterized [Tachysurus ichikawai]